MSTINNFFKKCKLPILWTIAYIFITWSILHILFNFELFSLTNWIRVFNSHLHGLGGFAFCLIIFACIPLYIATLTIVIRTQKPLLALPIPKFIAKIIEKIFPKQKNEQTSEQTKNESGTQTPDTSLDNIPAEMHSVFLRVRNHPNRINTPICNVCTVTPNIYPNTKNEQFSQNEPNSDDFPLPPDFDFEPEQQTDKTTNETSVPIFQDINLYEDFTQQSAITNPVTDYLTQSHQEFNINDDDIIVTKNAAIAIHNDPDFWIMDEPTWFASGKTRNSPIKKLLELAQSNKITPTLYLGHTNIMNFDNKRQEWESMGIHIITDLSDL